MPPRKAASVPIGTRKCNKCNSYKSPDSYIKTDSSGNITRFDMCLECRYQYIIDKQRINGKDCISCHKHLDFSEFVNRIGKVCPSCGPCRLAYIKSREPDTIATAVTVNSNAF